MIALTGKHHIMLDLETMSPAPDAAIVAIGAVEFDLDVLRVVRDPFYCVVDLKSSMDGGGDVDPDTIAWWMVQSEQARAVFAPEMDKQPIHLALLAVAAWMRQTPYRTVSDATRKVWGCGADFDNVIFASAWKRCGLGPLPWDARRNSRCYRTVREQSSVAEVARVGVHHRADDDALHQARHLIDIATVQREINLAAGA